MNQIYAAASLVFQDKRFVLMGIAVSIVLATFYLFLGGLVVLVSNSIFFDFNLTRIITFVALSLLAGLVVPLQIFALRKAVFSARSSGATGVSLVTGLATLSCCTPLLLPSLLVFFGWSALSILQVSALIQQYLLPLSVFSVLLLLISIRLVSESIVAACKIKV